MTTKSGTTVEAQDRFIRLGTEPVAADLPDTAGRFPEGPEAIADSLLDADTAPRLAGRVPADEQRQALARLSTDHLRAIIADRHPDATPPRLPVLTAEDASDAARTVLSLLPGDEFDYRWGRIEAAAARATLFAQPDGAACAHGVLPSEEAITVEEALGYVPDEDPEHPDWRRYADALATCWRQLRDAAIHEAVLAQANAWPDPA